MSAGRNVRRPSSGPARSGNGRGGRRGVSGQDELALAFDEEPSLPPSYVRRQSSIGANDPILASQQSNAAPAEDYHPLMPPSMRRAGGDSVTRRPPPPSPTSTSRRDAGAGVTVIQMAPPTQASEQGEHDVFFDMDDAMGTSNAAAPGDGASAAATAGASNSTTTPGYDFERQNYFGGASGAGPSSPTHGRARSGSSGSAHARLAADTRTAFGHTAEGSDETGGGDAGPEEPTSGLVRARVMLGRFGRFVGMRVPGAMYSTLSQHDQDGAAGGGSGGQRRRRVVGGGLGQDGVFGNLNAKPDRRRRRREADSQNDTDDRGEDDDLAEDTQPPAYETAAADAAPPYWETTIIGGPGSMHPFAPGGLGWTPGSPVIGALEDLILEGLPIGNLFGFAWNLLVSSSFQFVGFLLTYLLHTTHAAKCGSRAGLGITLVQYGYYLREAAGQGGGGLDDPPPPHAQSNAEKLAADIPARGLRLVARAQAAADESADTLSFILMLLGWFLLVSSTLSYLRVYRYGYQLVTAARRDQDSAAAATAAATTEGEQAEGGSGGSSEAASQGGFGARIRSLFASSGGAGAATSSSGSGDRPHTAEDWVIFPGAGRRLTDLEEGRASREAPRESDESLSPEEARLLSNLRGGGSGTGLAR